MPNLLEPLRLALMQSTGYHVMPFHAGDPHSLASIATPKGTLLLQITTIRLLASFSTAEAPMTKAYEVEYRLAMRYEDALEASAMSDLLTLPVGGSPPVLRCQRYHAPQRSFYVMEITAKAVLRYPEDHHAPIHAVHVDLHPNHPPIWIQA